MPLNFTLFQDLSSKSFVFNLEDPVNNCLHAEADDNAAADLVNALAQLQTFSCAKNGPKVTSNRHLTVVEM